MVCVSLLLLRSIDDMEGGLEIDQDGLLGCIQVRSGKSDENRPNLQTFGRVLAVVVVVVVSDRGSTPMISG